MSRLVSPYLFSLRVGNPLGTRKSENLAPVRDQYFAANAGLSVIALRWSTISNLGFPRQPFQVYRRRRYGLEELAYTVVQPNPVPATDVGTVVPVSAHGDLAYVVLAEAQVTSGSSLVVQALDVYGHPIPDQAVTMTHNGDIEIRCPAIAALNVSGSGVLGPIAAIGETVYANLADWQPIQTVGLPLLNNEIGTAYTTSPQGFWANPLTPPTWNGVEAAVVRVLITDLLQQAPPATGISDFPLPAWPRPNPVNYVGNIRTAGNLVPMIEQCLQNSVDSNPAQMQSAYVEAVTTEGLSQLGAVPPSPASPSSQVNLPVTGIALLAASTDCFASVGLGYGTVDIPPGAQTSAITVSVAPTSALVLLTETCQFTAALTGASSNGVVWSVNGVQGGNSGIGTISDSGLYTAPRTGPGYSIAVAATSVQDPTKFASATVQLAQFLTIAGGRPGAPAGPSHRAGRAPGEDTKSAKPAAPSTTPAAPSTTPAAPWGAPTPVPAAQAFAIVIGNVHTQPPADAYGNYDYMVTAPFVFPFNFSTTLAALSSGQLPVTAPTHLASAQGPVHAPLQRDQPTATVIRLTWDPAPAPQGYAILVSRAPDESQFLNAERAASVGGYDLFIGLPPANPNPDGPPGQQNPAFSDVQCVLPLALPATNNRYLVAAQDVFGLWSDWASTRTTLSPGPVTKPALMQAQFILPAAVPSSSPPASIVNATLQLDFGWNWQDRAPGQIRFTGQFVPAPATSLNPPYLGGFAMQSTGAIGPPVILTFSYTAVNPDTVDPRQIIPAITSGHASAGPVQILGEGSPPGSSSNPYLVQYRVLLTGISLDFSGADELDFLVYATATEEVQPGVWSDPTDQPTSILLASPNTPLLVIGKIVRALDPNPPVITFNPPLVSWTALPDASGTARGKLSWEADPNAAGYYVWEATESALLHLLPPGSPGGTPEASPPDTPALTRAATLDSLLTAYPDQSLQGFARLNHEPIQGSSAEVTLPGSAETLYVYRISAISANNVESARSSTVAIFGVPRRSVPGTPRILVRTASGSPSGLELIVIPVTSSAMPAGYRLFRVRSAALAQNASAMGPAKYDETSSLWQDYTSTTLAGSPLNGKSLIDTAAIPSWFPYYYRATAVGAEDLPNGVYSGESDYSRMQTGYVVPANPPLIAAPDFTVDAAGTSALITLETDLPAADASPLGAALVELRQLSPPGSPPGPLKMQQLLAEAPDEIAQAAASFPPLAPPAYPGLMTRSAPDANGVWTLSIVIPYSASEAGTFEVRLIDPMARQSSTTF
jgi:hypothetical protein